MSIVSQKLNQVKLSPSVAAKVIIAKLKEEGRTIIDLTVGEPDFTTPQHICQAAIEAMQRGETKYPLAQGTIPLRKAIQARLKQDIGVDYPTDQIIVSTGAKQVIYNGLAASLNEGDEVIIPAPFWLSYPDMVLINGGKPIIIETTANQHYKITAQQLEQAITPRTKWLIFNSPSNPTGAVYNKEEITALAQVLCKHPHVWLLSDDIYARLNFTDEPITHPVQVAPELAERTLAINGVSKSYAMTGWRIGYGAAPKELIKAMAVIQSQSTSGASSISQAAALAALIGPQDCVDIFRQTYKERRDAALAILKGTRGLNIMCPEGAFYLFVDANALIGKTTPQGEKIHNDAELVNHILQQTGVALLSGTAYGAPGNFRLSFTCALDSLKAGCQAIHNFCETLQ